MLLLSRYLRLVIGTHATLGSISCLHSTIPMLRSHMCKCSKLGPLRAREVGWEDKNSKKGAFSLIGSPILLLFTQVHLPLVLSTWELEPYSGLTMIRWCFHASHMVNFLQTLSQNSILSCGGCLVVLRVSTIVFLDPKPMGLQSFFGLSWILHWSTLKDVRSPSLWTWRRRMKGLKINHQIFRIKTSRMIFFWIIPFIINNLPIRPYKYFNEP